MTGDACTSLRLTRAEIGLVVYVPVRVFGILSLASSPSNESEYTHSFTAYGDVIISLVVTFQSCGG